MSNFNPSAHISKSRGIDLPILKVYLAGKISGNCIEECLAWRKEIIDHYKKYEWDEEVQDYASYPICFLDALNSKEADSIDVKGLTSCLPPNLIYDKDLLSVVTADALVCNMEDFMEVGIESLMDERLEDEIECGVTLADDILDYKKAYLKLKTQIKNRRENFGTISEFAIALYLQKPIILIVPEKRRENYEKHPFAKRASVIVTSSQQLIKEKWLEILYKSVAGAIY